MMINPITISGKIILHKRVYLESGYEVPLYRITGSEHKELIEHVKFIDKKESGIIAEYYGVPLEIVALVENIF